MVGGVVIPSIFQVLAEHRLRWIEGAIDDAHEQASECGDRILQYGVAAFPLKSSRGRINESEIPSRRILKFEHFVRHVRITCLSQHVHQRHGPLPAFRVGDDLALDVLPLVHAPQWHIYASSSSSALATCEPVNGFGISKTFWAFRERRLASASSGVSLMMTTGSSA